MKLQHQYTNFFIKMNFPIKFTSARQTGAVSKGSDIFICSAILYSSEAFNELSRRLRKAHYTVCKVQFLEGALDNNIPLTEITFNVILKTSKMTKYLGFWRSRHPFYALLSQYFFYSDLWSNFFYVLGKDFSIYASEGESEEY